MFGQQTSNSFQSLIPVDQQRFNEPCNLTNPQQIQASSSTLKNRGLTGDLPLVQKETVKSKEHKILKPWQSDVLNDFFNNKSQLPTDDDIKKLSLQLKRKEKSLKRWFYNKRHRLHKKTETQTNALETFYKSNKNPSREEIEKMSGDLGLSVMKIYKWFASRPKKGPKNASLRSLEKKYGVRREAKRFTSDERAVLNREYQKCKYPSSDDKLRISKELGCDFYRVYNWFNYQRGSSRSRLKKGVNKNKCVNKNKNEGENSTQPSEAVDQSFDLDINDIAWKHQLNENFGECTILEQHYSMHNNESHQGFYGKGKDLCLSEFGDKSKTIFMDSSCDNIESSVFIDPTVEPSKNNYLVDHKDEDLGLEDLIGDTTLFPEIFNDPNTQTLSQPSNVNYGNNNEHINVNLELDGLTENETLFVDNLHQPSSSNYQPEHDYMQYLNLK